MDDMGFSTAMLDNPQSMKATQNYRNGHTKFEFGMITVVISCGYHTLKFVV